MTYKYQFDAEAVLNQLPIEFREMVMTQAYDRCHSGGEDEVWMTAASLARDLVGAFQRHKDRTGVSVL